ncbi:MAG: hypothetical protein JSV56_09970 [Methanomassiliicoccales archaeon]|nr:MAG: hypothetical protein JSV56_09970 [Methanomassiliicoccales archaeon]
MKTIGLCHRCGKPAILSCPLCGWIICRSCYDAKHGVCLDCKGKKIDDFERMF